MDTKTLITALLGGLTSAILTKLWDWWRESVKVKEEKNKLMHGALYLLIEMFNNTESLVKHLSTPHSWKEDYLDSIRSYVDRLTDLDKQYENSLKEIGKFDPFIAFDRKRPSFLHLTNSLKRLENITEKLAAEEIIRHSSKDLDEFDSLFKYTLVIALRFKIQLKFDINLLGDKMEDKTFYKTAIKFEISPDEVEVLLQTSNLTDEQKDEIRKLIPDINVFTKTLDRDLIK